MKNVILEFRIIRALMLASLGSLLSSPQAGAQSTAVTYQGQLADNGSRASGNYDLRFAIFNAASSGSQVGPALTNALAISNGVFTVTLDFGNGVFTGPDRWLAIAVRTNGAAGFTTINPRQLLTSAPYAILAGSISGVVGSGSLSGAYSGALSLLNGANDFRGAFAGNGAGLTNLSAASLGGQTPSNFWQTAGNLNTTAGTHFLGTRDNEALELRVNNSRVARFEPGANVTLGNSANLITNGVIGSSIAGGRFNTNNANDSTIGGGRNNRIDPTAGLSSIGGGVFNTIEAGADQSVIGGGNSSTIELGARESFIGGGFANTLGSGGTVAFIGGGTRNTNSSFASFIGGGQVNTIETGSGNSVIGGGAGNTVSTNAPYATIPGGRSNSATDYAFAAGRRAKAIHQGAFVWGDSQNVDFPSTEADQFAVRAQGGVRLVTGAGGLTLEGNLHIQDPVTGTTVVELGAGLDFAEGFNVEALDTIPSGSVLSIDPRNPGKLQLCTTPYDRKVVGIVAGAKNLGSGVRLGSGQHDCDVALAGRVYCNVDATESAVETGDLLTTSSRAGYAMKVRNHRKAQGAVLGKAMEPLPKGRTGQILVLVTLQ